jgi:hypothetical protein
MTSLSRRTAVLASSAALALAGVAGPLAADALGHHANNGHHKMWTTKQCTNQAHRWQKAHKHPTSKQTAKENRLLARHSCTNTV